MNYVVGNLTYFFGEFDRHLITIHSGTDLLRLGLIMTKGKYNRSDRVLCFVITLFAAYKM